MTKAELSALRKLRRTLTMANASFAFADPKEDARIKEATRLWRESWIYPVLDDMIAKHEHKLEGKEKPKGWSSVTEDYSYFS